jgi:hypothetical protein
MKGDLANMLLVSLFQSEEATERGQTLISSDLWDLG